VAGWAASAATPATLAGPCTVERATLGAAVADSPIVGAAVSATTIVGGCRIDGPRLGWHRRLGHRVVALVVHAAIAEQLLDERREPIDLGLRRRLVRTGLARGRHAEVDRRRNAMPVGAGASVRPSAHASAPTSIPTAAGVLASRRTGGSSRILLWEGCSG